MPDGRALGIDEAEALAQRCRRRTSIAGVPRVNPWSPINLSVGEDRVADAANGSAAKSLRATPVRLAR